MILPMNRSTRTPAPTPARHSSALLALQRAHRRIRAARHGPREAYAPHDRPRPHVRAGARYPVVRVEGVGVGVGVRA